MTDSVHWMLMTGSVLRDPLLVGSSAQHAQDDITIGAEASLNEILDTLGFSFLPAFWLLLWYSCQEFLLPGWILTSILLRTLDWA